MLADDFAANRPGPYSRKDLPVFIRALMRPLIVLAMLALTLPSLVAAQGVDVTTVALITPASRTNLGWDQQAADGLEAVAKAMNIRAEIQENAGYDDITPSLRISRTMARN